MFADVTVPATGAFKTDVRAEGEGWRRAAAVDDDMDVPVMAVVFARGVPRSEEADVADMFARRIGLVPRMLCCWLPATAVADPPEAVRDKRVPWRDVEMDCGRTPAVAVAVVVVFAAVVAVPRWCGVAGAGEGDVLPIVLGERARTLSWFAPLPLLFGVVRGVLTKPVDDDRNVRVAMVGVVDLRGGIMIDSFCVFVWLFLFGCC